MNACHQHKTIHTHLTLNKVQSSNTSTNIPTQTPPPHHHRRLNKRQGCFFRMVAFAGERVLELEAPIRNEGTKATLAGWGRTQDEVEGGRRRLEPSMVRECFEYLFSKVREHEGTLEGRKELDSLGYIARGTERENDRGRDKGRL